MKKKVCMGLSGGMDSTTMLSILLNEYKYEINCLIFRYGSKHNKYENVAAERIANYYEVNYRIVDLTNVGNLLKSDLLLSGGKVPEGHYSDESMSRTVVPGRNIIFASILAGYAWSTNCDAIALGVHLGDRAIYPDCTPEFVKSLDTCIYLGTGKRIEVLAPLIGMNKIDICKKGLELKVPFSLTRTCYKDQDLSCGKCGACNERLEAFELNNAKDPLRYEGE